MGLLWFSRAEASLADLAERRRPMVVPVELEVLWKATPVAQAEVQEVSMVNSTRIACLSVLSVLTADHLLRYRPHHPP
jgi:hypothetical protein